MLRARGRQAVAEGGSHDNEPVTGLVTPVRKGQHERAAISASSPAHFHSHPPSYVNLPWVHAGTENPNSESTFGKRAEAEPRREAVTGDTGSPHTTPYLQTYCQTNKKHTQFKM